MSPSQPSALLRVHGAASARLRHAQLAPALERFGLRFCDPAEESAAAPPQTRLLRVAGDLSGLQGLRRELAACARREGVEAAVEPYPAKRCRLVAIDMDSTLIGIEVIDELAAMAGVGRQVAEITERATKGEIDFTESLLRRVSLLANLHESRLREIDPPLNDGALALCSHMRKLNCKTALITSGFAFAAAPLAASLGLDYVRANRLEVSGGQLTGKLEGTIVDGPGKARQLREIAEREGVAMDETLAIGDGANDLPMMRAAGASVAFRAKEAVVAAADYAVHRMGLDAIIPLCGGLALND